MEVKQQTKRCSIRLQNKIRKPIIESELKTESEKRCFDWINSQKRIPKKARKTAIDRNSLTKFDRSPEPSADSLSILKKQRSTKNDNITYICEWKDCMVELKDSKALQDHIGKHISELHPLRKKYYCLWDLCQFQTDCGEEITRHVFYHSYHTILKTKGESLSQKVSMPRCTNDSRQRNLVPVDLKQDFICYWEDCLVKYKSIHYFHLHVKEHVTFEKVLMKSEKKKIVQKCKWNNCDASFSVTYRLTEHLRKHINERIIGCYHCGALFSNNTNFFDHCKRQEVSQEFQCAQCLKYFASERLLRAHVLVHVNSHKCSICEMTCNSAYHLAKHIRYRHINDRPFQCSLCKYRCVSKYDLSVHVMYKHKKKSVACSEIGCKFVGKSLHFLRKHELEEHTKAIYACHCCDEQYKHGRELSNHLRKIHNYQMLPGHRRFTYRMDENGLYRLQTLRIESLEVTEQVASPQTLLHTRNYEGISFHIKKMEQNSPENIKGPFKIIASHDAASLEHNNIIEKFEQDEDVKLFSEEEVIITYKRIDDDGNVIESKCITTADEI